MMRGSRARPAAERKRQAVSLALAVEGLRWYVRLGQLVPDLARHLPWLAGLSNNIRLVLEELNRLQPTTRVSVRSIAGMVSLGTLRTALESLGLDDSEEVVLIKRENNPFVEVLSRKQYASLISKGGDDHG